MKTRIFSARERNSEENLRISIKLVGGQSSFYLDKQTRHLFTFYFITKRQQTNKKNMNCFRSDLVQPEREKVEGMIERLKSTKGAELVKTCELLAYEVFLPWLNKQNGT